MFLAPILIASHYQMSVMDNPIDHGSPQLVVGEHLATFREGKIRCHYKCFPDPGNIAQFIEQEEVLVPEHGKGFLQRPIIVRFLEQQHQLAYIEELHFVVPMTCYDSQRYHAVVFFRTTASVPYNGLMFSDVIEAQHARLRKEIREANMGKIVVLECLHSHQSSSARCS